ncbi:MAG TPA: hypothetical protein VJM79_04720, partial [Rhizorhapis sp.]|nr:hypothetical protein [Rhizorhapis sp.]
PLPEFEADADDAKPAKGKDKPEPKAETKKAPAAPAKKKAATGTKPGQKGDGYKGHRVGSNKETVHKVYDDKGRDAAIKKAAALELADNTARSWISSWGPSDADKGKAKK